MSTLEVNTINPQSGTTITIGGSGDTVSLGSGATQSGFGGVNTPAFLAYNGSDQSLSDSVKTLVTCNTEVFDTDSAYNNSTYLFTAPSAGKYFFYAFYNLFSVAVSLYRTQQWFVKNGSGGYPNDSDRYLRRDAGSYPDFFMGGYCCVVADMSASDTMGFHVYGDVGGGSLVVKGGNYFGGYKLIT